LVVTAGEGWQEHRQAGWPEAAARIQQCDVERYSHSRGENASWIIECRISYLVGPEEIVTKVRSRSMSGNRAGHWEYPSGRIERRYEWVDTHPAGSPMAVHYDPDDHRKAALVQTDMPYGGPRTPSNLRLLAFTAIASIVLISVARLMQLKASKVQSV